MRHLNYFLALVPAGSFALLMVLGSVLTLPFELVVYALGMRPSSETIKFVSYCTVAVLWSMVLVGLWVRNKGLSPIFIKPGRAFPLLCGHLCLLAGHAIVLFILLAKDSGFFMILPVVGVLFFYAAGIVLIETSRDRQRAQRHDA